MTTSAVDVIVSTQVFKSNRTIPIHVSTVMNTRLKSLLLEQGV